MEVILTSLTQRAETEIEGTVAKKAVRLPSTREMKLCLIDLEDNSIRQFACNNAIIKLPEKNDKGLITPDSTGLNKKLDTVIAEESSAAGAELFRLQSVKFPGKGEREIDPPGGCTSACCCASHCKMAHETS